MIGPPVTRRELLNARLSLEDALVTIGTDALSSAYSKLAWTDTRHSEMERTFEKFLHTSEGGTPYGIRFHTLDKPAGLVRAQFTVEREMPEEMSLLAGDLVHNTRVAQRLVALDDAERRALLEPAQRAPSSHIDHPLLPVLGGLTDWERPSALEAGRVQFTDMIERVRQIVDEAAKLIDTNPA